ncbi:MAG: tRNA-uridine aminocarboxypropyltransferase [Opitutaceae bacterium]
MRSVVRGTTIRCERCRQPSRWCICDGLRPVWCPLQVDVLAHHREIYRPSSTGLLIRRVLPESRHHVWRRERHLSAHDVRLPGRELWIVHPHGPPAPGGARAEDVQLLLLDGAWGEASSMAREVASWGRTVSLPITGESRYWLRAQTDAGRFSTVEALLFLLRSFGLHEAAGVLAAQFELHVYVGLRARGRKETAEAFLAGSNLAAEFPALLAALHTRRPHHACAAPDA